MTQTILTPEQAAKEHKERKTQSLTLSQFFDLLTMPMDKLERILSEMEKNQGK